MTKNEIIEAINATIAPNNQKGITAESLANILIEMVNASGEGGAGALRVHWDAGMLDIPFTPASYEALFSSPEGAGIGGLENPMYKAAQKCFADNAAAYQTILQKTDSWEGILCMLDASMMSSVIGEYEIGHEEPTLEFYNISSAYPCTVNAVHAKAMGEEILELVLEFRLADTKIQAVLLPDGGIEIQA